MNLFAQRTTVIPVSCVESGMWRHVSQGFASAPRAQFGEGDDVRLSGGDVSGAALVVDGRVIHLSAFPAAERNA